MTLDPVAKALMILGGLIFLCGVGWQMGWLQALKLGKLPGDIAIEKENMKFYFPLTTGLLISLVLTFLSWLWRR
jgi:hypothetical protein